MIPQHIIDKAAQGIWESETTSAWPGASSVWSAPARNRARAALEAVAAELWYEGYWARGEDEEYDTDTPNPYASETA